MMHMTIQSFVEKKDEKKNADASREEELTHTLQRVQADFDNFRKRTQAEQQIFYLRGKAAAMKDLLAFADALDAAVQKSHAEHSKGMDSLRAQLLSVLAMNGVKPMDVVGKSFDPFTCECLQQGHDASKPEDLVLEEFQKGYYFHDDVLRTAKVRVNKVENTGKENNQENNGGNKHE